MHLTEDNRCAIYETRPDICRVDRLKPDGMTFAEWYRANAAACNALQDEDGADPKYRVLTPERSP